MDNPASWVVFSIIVIVALCAFFAAIANEKERRRANSENTWKDLVNEQRELNWWELH